MCISVSYCYISVNYSRISVIYNRILIKYRCIYILHQFTFIIYLEINIILWHLFLKKSSQCQLTYPVKAVF